MEKSNPNMLPDEQLDAVAGGLSFGDSSVVAINEGDYVQAWHNGQWQQARVLSIGLSPSFDLIYTVQFGYFSDGGSFVITGSGDVSPANIAV